MIVGSITVRKILSVSSVHNRISVTVTFVTAAVHSESHGQQPQRINLVTGFQIAILEIPFRLGATFRFQIFFILLKSATKLFSVLLASKRPLITELADKLRLKYPLLPTISPCPTMRLEAIRSIIPISCRRYPKSV